MGIPYQLLHHRFPNLARAKVFGCLGQIWVLPQHRRKLQEQAQWGVCLGVPSHTKGWEFYLPATGEVGHVSRNVVFHENLFFPGLPQLLIIPLLCFPKAPACR